jgi:hypothetical protein
MRSEESSNRAVFVRLWSAGPLLCTCRLLSTTTIEICLELNGHTLERRTFSDSARATQFAIDKMHVYGGR